MSKITGIIKVDFRVVEKAPVAKYHNVSHCIIRSKTLHSRDEPYEQILDAEFDTKEDAEFAIEMLLALQEDAIGSNVVAQTVSNMLRHRMSYDAIKADYALYKLGL